MIDHGLSASAVDDFIEHYFFDTDMIDCMIIDDDYSYKFYYRKAPGNPQSMANVPVEIIENSTGQVVWEIRL